MKIRHLILWSIGCMLTACTTIYKIVPPGGVSAPPAATVAAEPTLSPQTSAGHVDEGPLSVQTRIGHSHLSVDGERRTFVLVMVKGRDVPGETIEVSGNTALVIDSSGSMSGARMSFARRAAERWIASSGASDMVSIVSFDDTAHVVARATDMSGGRQFLSRAVRTLSANGGTCLSCGLFAARTEVHRTTGRVNRIVLLSDGEANAGIRDVPGIRQLATNFRDQGVSVTTVGVGAAYNEDLLTELAFFSNGLHHFVKRPSDIPRIFEEEATTLANTVATDVTARIRLAEGVEAVRVLDRDARIDAGMVEVPLGAIAVGQTRTVLVEVRLPASGGALGTVEVGESAASSLTVPVSAGPDSALDPLVAMRLQRSHTAAALDRATILFKSGSATAAAAHLRTYRGLLASAAQRINLHAQKTKDPAAIAIRADLASQLRQTSDTMAELAAARPKSTEGSHATKKSRRTFRVMGL